MLGFAFATLAAVLATFLTWWLSLLLVTAFLGLLAGVLGAIAVASVKKATPPVPETAIREAKLTAASVKP